MSNSAKQCRLGLFQDSDFAGDLEDSKSTSGGTLCIVGSHTFVLTLDGIHALELWDLIVSVLGNMTQTTERPERPVIIDKSHKSQGETNVLNNIDCVPSNVQPSRQEALCA